MTISVVQSIPLFDRNLASQKKRVRGGVGVVNTFPLDEGFGAGIFRCASKRLDAYPEGYWLADFCYYIAAISGIQIKRF